MARFKFAACQLLVSENKQLNFTNAERLIRKAASLNANVVSLPECWNCPYSNSAFPVYAEEVHNPESSPSFQFLSNIAKELKIYLIGGSIPEKDANGKIYNTSLSFGRDGELLGKFRKMHLFDIDIPGKITFKESETLSPGDSFCTLDTEYCKIGVGICYDVRFPELARKYQEIGCRMVVYPGAFNMITGPAHWELLLRSRSLDYQLFVAGVSPARDPASTYQAWGHSTIIDPWGRVLATTEHEEDVIIHDIDIEYQDTVRQQIPVLSQRKIIHQ